MDANQTGEKLPDVEYMYEYMYLPDVASEEDLLVPVLVEGDDIADVSVIIKIFFSCSQKLIGKH
jgi:hypothetical protein